MKQCLDYVMDVSLRVSKIFAADIIFLALRKSTKTGRSFRRPYSRLRHRIWLTWASASSATPSKTSRMMWFGPISFKSSNEMNFK